MTFANIRVRMYNILRIYNIHIYFVIKNDDDVLHVTPSLIIARYNNNNNKYIVHVPFTKSCRHHDHPSKPRSLRRDSHASSWICV